MLQRLAWSLIFFQIKKTRPNTAIYWQHTAIPGFILGVVMTPNHGYSAFCFGYHKSSDSCLQMFHDNGKHALYSGQTWHWKTIMECPPLCVEEKWMAPIIDMMMLMVNTNCFLLPHCILCEKQPLISYIQHSSLFIWQWIYRKRHNLWSCF